MTSIDPALPVVGRPPSRLLAKPTRRCAPVVLPAAFRLGLLDRFVLAAGLPIPFAAAEVVGAALLDQLHASLGRQRVVGLADGIGLPLRWRRRRVLHDHRFLHDGLLDDDGVLLLDPEEGKDEAVLAVHAAIGGERIARPAADRALLRLGSGCGEEHGGRSRAEGQEMRSLHGAHIAPMAKTGERSEWAWPRDAECRPAREQAA